MDIDASKILQFTLTIFTSFFDEVSKLARFNRLKMARLLKKIQSQEFVFFFKTDDIAALNQVMIYVSDNETTNKLKIVTVLKDGEAPSESFLKDLAVLDRIYPDIDINFVTITGEFTPELISSLSTEWKIPMNYMFISSFGLNFKYQISDLGGVRLIL